MNVKPGDLAVIVREAARGTCADRILGRLCTVLFAAPSEIFVVIDDRKLRPLRDPGDDARDETLEWLPVPSAETV